MKKAKVWRRGDAAEASTAGAAQPCSTNPSPCSTSADARRPPNPSNHIVREHGKRQRGNEVGTHPPYQAPAPTNERPKLVLDNTAQNKANVTRKLQEKEQELQRLRQKLEEQERLLLKKKREEDIQDAVKKKSEEQQRELKRRRQAMAKGFGAVADAAPSSRPTASSTSAQHEPSRPAIPVADASEVQRVLSSADDYVCLKLHAGTSLAQVRRSYRQLAIALHPDKCRLEGAAAAFQRLNSAYNNLSRLLGTGG